jgi:hypothetical protein
MSPTNAYQYAKPFVAPPWLAEILLARKMTATESFMLAIAEPLGMTWIVEETDWIVQNHTGFVVFEPHVFDKVYEPLPKESPKP